MLMENVRGLLTGGVIFTAAVLVLTFAVVLVASLLTAVFGPPAASPCP